MQEDLRHLIAQMERDSSVGLTKLPADTRLEVQIQNSRYRLRLVDPARRGVVVQSGA